MFWKTTGCEQGERGRDGKPVVCDGQVFSKGFLLGLFELVDVLGDSWIILPSTQHVDNESDDVRSVEAGHVGGKMIQHVSEGHVIVEGGCTLEREQPCVLDNAEEEETAVTFDGSDEALELSTSRPIAFGAGSRGVGGVSGNGLIVRSKRDEHGVKGDPVKGDVVGVSVD